MTQIQLLQSNKSLLKIMSENSMRIKDVELAEIVEEANRLGSQYKKSYVVQLLADKHHISVRSIYSAITRLNKEILL